MAVPQGLVDTQAMGQTMNDIENGAYDGAEQVAAEGVPPQPVPAGEQALPGAV